MYLSFFNNKLAFFRKYCLYCLFLKRTRFFVYVQKISLCCSYNIDLRLCVHFLFKLWTYYSLFLYNNTAHVTSVVKLIYQYKGCSLYTWRALLLIWQNMSVSRKQRIIITACIWSKVQTQQWAMLLVFHSSRIRLIIRC